MKKIFLIILSLFFIVPYIFSQGAGITSANFLKISQGGRQVGMGEAFTGIADDVNAIYWNPAGLAQLKRHQACLMHAFWLLQVYMDYLAYALPLPGVGTIAIYGTLLNGGEITKTDEDSAGDYVLTNEIATASNLNITLGFAKKLSDIIGEKSSFSDLYLGLSLNVINEQIYTDSGGGFAANIGAYYYPKYENYSIGLVINNAGVTNNRPSLPLTIRLGFGYRFAFDNILLPFTEEGYFIFLKNDSKADIDIIYYPIEGFARVNAGVERYWQLNKYHGVSLRLGYKFGYDLGILSGFTFGVGYTLTVNKSTQFSLDYGITPYTDIDWAHRVSLTGKFLGEAESHFYEDKKEALKYYKRGVDLLYKKEYSKALVEFSSSLKRNHNYAPAYIGVGACFFNLGKRKLAIKAYEKALQLDPSNEKLKKFLEDYKGERTVKSGR